MIRISQHLVQAVCSFLNRAVSPTFHLATGAKNKRSPFRNPRLGTDWKVWPILKSTQDLSIKIVGLVIGWKADLWISVICPGACAPRMARRAGSPKTKMALMALLTLCMLLLSEVTYSFCPILCPPLAPTCLLALLDRGRGGRHLNQRAMNSFKRIYRRTSQPGYGLAALQHLDPYCERGKALVVCVLFLCAHVFVYTFSHSRPMTQ